MSKEIRLVAFVFAILLVTIAWLLSMNTNAVDANTKVEEQEQITLLREEYQNVLMGCNTSGALDSKDEWLRELCDEYLPKLRKEMMDN